MHIPKRLVATAGLLFVVLIATVTFFMGRATSHPAEAPIAATAVPQQAPADRTPAPEGEVKPPLAEAVGASTLAITTPVSETARAAASTEPIPAGAMTAAPMTDNSRAEAGARVAAYFQQMEALQSGGAIDDQEAFANTIMQGAVSGNFSGIDDLVRTANEAERRAAAVQPPSECAEYHRIALTLLQESTAMVTALRDGLKRNDTNALTSIGASAQSMKSRADALAAAEKALRARFGL